MNGQYTYPSFDGSVPAWPMAQSQYYAQQQYDHRHVAQQQVPVAQVPLAVDAHNYPSGYGYPSYAQQHAYSMEQPARSRFAFASVGAPAHSQQQFTLPPPAYSYAASFGGAEEHMRSHSHERTAAWGIGGDYGRQESAQRATLNGEQQLQFLLGRLSDSHADLCRRARADLDNYNAHVAIPDDDKTVVYDLIPNTSSVPPPPPVELSAVPLADLAVEMTWEACRQGFLLARDNQIAAAHAASLQSSASRRRSGRDSFGTIGDGRLRSASADGFASDSSSVSSSLPGTPGLVSAQEEEARQHRLANLGLSDFMPHAPSRKATIPTLSAATFPVEPSVAFRQFVKQILSATLVTPEDLVLALYYVAQIAPADIIPPTPAEGGQDAQTTSFKAAPFKIFLGSLMLANKSLQDNSYRNETFATVSGIPLKDVNALEIYVFSALKYDVALREDKWVQWLNTIAFKVLAGVRGEIGDRFAIEEALGRLVYAARNNKNTIAAPVASSSVPAATLAPVAEAESVSRRTPVSRGGPCRMKSDVPSLLPPVSLADTRSRSFGQEVSFRAVC
ncbi:cyclin family protein [Sporobolomyces koalae]|uniref:cyclin family protein n=1 Tax=Sporobolomyces koalae TaxID=500713 RepID=UPI00316D149B